MMFVLAPVIRYVPLAGLAGVLMITAWRMNEWESIRFLFRNRFKGGMFKFLATMAATIVFDLTVAILVGVSIALVLQVSRLSHLQINYEKVDMDRIKVADPALRARYSNAVVAYITGPLLFANIDTLEEIPEHLNGADTLLLSIRGVPDIDVSAAQFILQQARDLRAQGIDVIVCGITNKALDMFDRSGLLELLDPSAIYWSVERALLDNRPRPIRSEQAE